MIPESQLAHWEQLCREATEGKWMVVYDGSSDWRVCVNEDATSVADTIASLYRYHAVDCSDASFIAEARTALPALLAEVRRLKRIAEKHFEYFTCPSCGGSHFGTTGDGTRMCHDEFEEGCRWTGPDAECINERP